MNIVLIISAIIGTFLAIWGSQTRGTLSQKMDMIGGTLWLASIVAFFIVENFKSGVILLIFTFLLAAVLTRVLPKNV